jgi:serine/threonine protein kinase
MEAVKDEPISSAMIATLLDVCPLVCLPLQIIHRDVKPDNIFVNKSNRQESS